MPFDIDKASTRHRFWLLSMVNWGVAIAAASLSVYLGVARPTSMFVYSIIFVVGAAAVVVGVVAWIVARFGHEVPPTGDAPSE